MSKGGNENLRSVPLPGGEEQVIPKGGAWQWHPETGYTHSPTLQQEAAEVYGIFPPKHPIAEFFINLYRSLGKTKQKDS